MDINRNQHLRGEPLLYEKIEEVPTYQVYPIPTDLVPKSGLLSIGRTSSKEKGDL